MKLLTLFTALLFALFFSLVSCGEIQTIKESKAEIKRLEAERDSLKALPLAPYCVICGKFSGQGQPRLCQEHIEEIMD